MNIRAKQSISGSMSINKTLKGERGNPGAVFVPSVDNDGTLSWTNDGGLLNPNPVNIKGPKGDPAYVTPDFAQNNPSAPDYVKNRTHYVEEVESVLIEKQSFEFRADDLIGFSRLMSYMWGQFDLMSAQPGTPATVEFDSVVYKVDVIAPAEANYMIGCSNGRSIGNASLMDYGDADTGEPFVIYVAEGGPTFIMVDVPSDAGTETHTLSLTVLREIVHPIDPKYLPQGGVGYSEEVEEVLVSEQKIDFGSPYPNGTWGGGSSEIANLSLPVGEPLVVTFDGVKYEVIAPNAYTLGNASLCDAGEDTGEPFCVYMGFARAKTSGVHSIKITKVQEAVHKLDAKYLPDAPAVSWNNLTDKPFYKITNGEKVYVVEGVTVEGDASVGCVLDFYTILNILNMAGGYSKGDNLEIRIGGFTIPVSWTSNESSSGLALEIKVLNRTFYARSNGSTDTIVFTLPGLASGVYDMEWWAISSTTVVPLPEEYAPLLTSPNGTKYKLTVSDSGTLSAVAVTE